MERAVRCRHSALTGVEGQLRWIETKRQRGQTTKLFCWALKKEPLIPEVKVPHVLVLGVNGRSSLSTARGPGGVEEDLENGSQKKL